MRIYFLGIAGTAMGNAALLLRAAGHEVLGADEGVYPPMSDVLAAAGISFHDGYSADRLRKLAPDLVVVGNALSRGNPEIEWLLESKAIRCKSLPEVLSEYILAGRRNIVVAGTHGKTTTTAMAAFLLQESGAQPGYLIGGAPADPPTGTSFGDPEAPFVIEGDEYDSAFFDKRSKFIHYSPHVAVLNNLEFDHADIFRDLQDVLRTFSHFLRIVPRNGFVVVNGDDRNLARLLPIPWTTVLRVGVGRDMDLQIRDFQDGPDGSGFELWWRGRLWTELTTGLSGLYNARNMAMAALAAGLTLFPNDPARLDPSPLDRFRAVRRRQELLWKSDSLSVIEDFGHHPTAIRLTVESLRARFPGAEIVAAFEPRSNTARVRTLQEDFKKSLGVADTVLLGPVSRADKLAPEDRFDTAAVVRALGPGARAFASNGDLLQHLLALPAAADDRERVVVFFSNGSFDGIMRRYVEALSGTAVG